MIRLAMLLFCASMLASPESVPAQQPAAPPPPPAPGAPPAPRAPEDFAVEFTMFSGNFLGVQVEEVTRENAGSYGLTGEPRGVGVREVVKGSPAEHAGLRERDVITRFDGEPVTSVRKLTRLVEEAAPEHAARLTILRGGSQQEVTATLGRREPFALEGARAFMLDPEEWRRHGEEWQQRGEEMRKQLEEAQRNNPGGWAFATAAGRRIGVTTTGLGKQLADYFGVQHGLLINSVVEGSPADKAGLKAGDVVTEADGERVDDTGDLSRIINRREEGDVTLTVVRDKQRRTVRVTPERREPGAFTITPGAVPAAPRVSVTPRPVVPPRAPRVRPALPRIIRRSQVI